MSEIHLVYVMMILFGLVVGSFLNVVIDRLPVGETLVRGRSHCDHCKRTLEWYELIPLISFLRYGARCRTCRGKLSWQYPAIEILTALVGVSFLSTLLPYPITFDLVNKLTLLIFVFAMVPVAVIDIKHGIIPDQIISFLIWIFSLGAVLSLGFELAHVGVLSIDLIVDWVWSWLWGMVDAVGAGAFFYLLVMVTNGRGMGGGDVKFVFVAGLFLTTMETFLMIYIAFLVGGVFAGWLLISGRKKFGQTVPFGPFLVGGAFLAIVWHEELVSLYHSLLF